MNIFRKTKTQNPRANHNDLLGGLILFNWSYRKRYVLLQLDGRLLLRRIAVCRFNTASGKYCCNSIILNSSLLKIEVSIPQAVSTVATYTNTDYNSWSITVSIPQAVSTVATPNGIATAVALWLRFNTASGKYCCNFKRLALALKDARFNTASGKYCCNL